MTIDSISGVLGLGVLASPALLLAVLGLAPSVGRPMGEAAIARWTASCVVAGLLSALGVLALMLATGQRHVPVEFGDWVAIPSEHFHFRLKFIFDRLSTPFLILTLVMVGTIGAFADRYLHREPGYGRFFRSFAVFLLGMVVASLAGTIETLFLGWELVGLSSALLVAFFYERAAPVINAQRIWSVYRISDAAFLLAAVALHRVSGEGDFATITGTSPWPEGEAALSPGQALGVGLLLLVAASGKSGLVPFSGWLPRAMEGPTPSSAVFYGALSVHLGTFLLLRASPIIDRSETLGAAVVAVGLASAVFAAIAGRVQADAKSALAFASLTQVGIITAEIGLGLRYIPLIHMIGHACLRTLQLLRAPSLLHDYHQLENAIGGHLPRGEGLADRWLPERARRAICRFGFERGHLDAAIDRFVVGPFLKAFRWCDRMERRWTDLLTGSGSRESDRVPPSSPIGEES
ncbi:proton-conducting transporter transmembrane domain-containing protein [Tautonia sociabilis]|uniref:Oxidoreductase n=1 Tax=Tautonia sociabilis TaxID=2080755 RepID=A0A432MGF7_9BACT|nr:proton-conducting transporter membrane subunit [Tautonia sociabilis]RUL85817.1 oxidoreductase [Tautonia sociabilis]